MYYCEYIFLTYFINTNRYTILAPNSFPKGFCDAKKVTESILSAIQLEANDYRLGHTKARIGICRTCADRIFCH